MDDINENDCCGNGCANCILDVKPLKNESLDLTGKQNILGKYTEFILENKTLHNPDVQNVWELHFKSKYCKNKDFVLNIYAGHHLMLRRLLTEKEISKSNDIEVEMKRKYLLRPYSPFWWNSAEMEFKILINLIPNGPMSEYLKVLHVNDEVEFRGPIGSFKHQVDVKGDKYLLIISQGIAIASVIPVIEEILNNEDDMTRILHIACFPDIKHIYFRDKLYDFGKFWNYKANIFLSREICSNKDCQKNLQCLEKCTNFKNKLKYNEEIKSHRLTGDEFTKLINGLNYANKNKTFIVSGNENFQKCYKKLCLSIAKSDTQNTVHLL